jgi:hypothetical protein
VTDGVQQQHDVEGASGHMTIPEDLQIDCAPATAFDLMADARNETQWKTKPHEPS